MAKKNVLLGFNEIIVKAGAEVLATASAEYRSLPLLVTGSYGQGRSIAWTSDIGPHWLPPQFCAWDGIVNLWTGALDGTRGGR